MQKINLNYHWQYKRDFDEKYLDKAYNDAGFQLVDIPHANLLLDYNNFDEKEYQFVSCYRKAVEVPGQLSGKSLILKFEGISSHAQLYVNGRFVSQHSGGYTPFEADISDKVVFGQENLFAVVCDSTEREEIPPFGKVMDYLAYGGIYREVWLEARDKKHIRDIFVKTPDVLSAAKTLDIDIELSQPCSGMTLELRLLDHKSRLVSKFIHAAGDSAKICIRHRLSDILLWELENPVLYTLEVLLKEGGEAVDSSLAKVGFRHAEFKADGFYLNGKKIKLVGLNRHQSYPYAGYAMPESAQKKDADLLKFELGVNMVRTSHYPQSRHFLDRCDEIGLLVFEEIPGWQHIGNEKWKELSYGNVRSMILRDRNHPSIVLWGVRINESADCNEFYMNTNRIAHELDNTRQTGGVRNFKDSLLLEDVYTYNDFLHNGSNAALELPSRVTKSNAPYLVTEHNGHMFPTKRFDNEARRLEHALRHMRVLDAMMGSDRISGAIGWCMFDYNTHKDFGSGDRICYHGVSDMFRIPKLAWAVYSSQQDRTPVLELSSSMDMGEHSGGNMGTVYAFTNCDCIKLYKDNEFIKTFYPDRRQFPNLKHPPVKIDDFIGDLLAKYENMPGKDSLRMKNVLQAASRYGINLPLGSKLAMARLMLKYKLSMDDGIRLFGTYVSNWGGKRINFRFEGYKEGKLVKSVVKSTLESARLEVLPDTCILKEADTYDAARIVLRALDQNGNLLNYASDAVSIKTEGPVEVIGPKTIALIGGARAVWIRTMGRSGKGVVRFISEKFGTHELIFEVIKKKPD